MTQPLLTVPLGSICIYDILLAAAHSAHLSTLIEPHVACARSKAEAWNDADNNLDNGAVVSALDVLA
jgi:hypothetical protein